MAQGHGQGVHLAARSSVLNDTMTSSAGELLNWMALLLMTGDHVAKVLGDGCFPVVSELGRIAFRCSPWSWPTQPGTTWRRRAQVRAQAAAVGHPGPAGTCTGVRLLGAVQCAAERCPGRGGGLEHPAPRMAAARHVRPGRSTAAGLQLERIDSCACRPGVVFRLRIVPHAPRQAAPRNGFRDWSESLTVRLLVLAGSFVPLCCWNVSGWALLANRDFPIPRT